MYAVWVRYDYNYVKKELECAGCGIKSHHNKILAYVWNKAGNTLDIKSDDPKVVVKNVLRFPYNIIAVEFSSTDQYLMIAQDTGKGDNLSLLDLYTGKFINFPNMHYDYGINHNIHFSPDDQFVVIQTNESCSIWEIEKGQDKAKQLTSFDVKLEKVEFAKGETDKGIQYYFVILAGKFKNGSNWVEWYPLGPNNNFAYLKYQLALHDVQQAVDNHKN
jgi:hypothetical protein